ncbi:MAG: D-glycerate dehydrogenase [Halioglobus sp.]|nr:D-glycerate dehydrogenase [Halioglobus sp.]
MTPLIYVTAPLAGERLSELAAHCDLRIADSGAGLNAANAPPLLAQCQGLLCLLTDRIDAALLDRMPDLRFVSSVSVGVDHVDVAALTERGIPLGHTPGVLVEATADTAFALLLAAARRVAEGDRFVRAGHWVPESRWAPDFFLGKDVSGATLGIVGLGGIGQAVARRALAFGMRVIAWSRSGRRMAGVDNVSLETLLQRSDFVSVHVALCAATRNLLNADRIATMKPGAVLVNTARGDIVDEAALAMALNEQRLFAAGLDVFEREPLDTDSALLEHPRVVFTPHIGSATGQTRAAMLGLAIDNALAVLQGREMPRCANPQVYTR